MLRCLRISAAVLLAVLCGVAQSGPAAAHVPQPIVLANVPAATYGARTQEFVHKGYDRSVAVPFLIICLARLQIRNYEGAVIACDRALVLDPSSPDGYRMRGAAKLALRHVEASLPDFDRSVALEPGNPDGYALRGTAYREEERFALAISDFSRAIALRPSDDRFWNGRCWVRAMAGVELNHALADCRHAFQLRPDRASTLDSIGFVMLRLARWRTAQDMYDSALGLDPGLATSLFGRGLAKLHLYGSARASEDIAHSLKLDPYVSEIFVKAHLIAETSPILLCQGHVCPPHGPVRAPQRPHRRGPARGVRVTKA